MLLDWNARHAGKQASKQAGGSEEGKNCDRDAVEV